MALADRYIRNNAAPREIGTIVAEDVPEMRKHLKGSVKFWRDNPVHFGIQLKRETTKDEAAGFSVQDGDMRVSRIRNTIHFVEKSDDPMVQVADACAYGFRRYFAQEKFGVEFARAILGDEKGLSHFASPQGAECFFWAEPQPALNV